MKNEILFPSLVWIYVFRSNFVYVLDNKKPLNSRKSSDNTHDGVAAARCENWQPVYICYNPWKKECNTREIQEAVKQNRFQKIPIKSFFNMDRSWHNTLVSSVFVRRDRVYSHPIISACILLMCWIVLVSLNET